MWLFVAFLAVDVVDPVVEVLASDEFEVLVESAVLLDVGVGVVVEATAVSESTVEVDESVGVGGSVTGVVTVVLLPLDELVLPIPDGYCPTSCRLMSGFRSHCRKSRFRYPTSRHP